MVIHGGTNELEMYIYIWSFKKKKSQLLIDFFCKKQLLIDLTLTKKLKINFNTGF